MAVDKAEWQRLTQGQGNGEVSSVTIATSVQYEVLLYSDHFR